MIPDIHPFINSRKGGQLYCFALGVIAVLGQAPFHWWFITIVCMACLVARLKLARKRDNPAISGFSHGFCFAFGYFISGTYWVGSAFIARGPEFIPIMPPMVIALSLILASFWGLAGAFFCRIKKNNLVDYFAFVSLFFLAEFTRGTILGGLPWNLLGYIFEAGGPISQSASVWGVYGLTFFALSLGYLFYIFIFTNLKWQSLVIFTIATGTLFSIGSMRIQNYTPQYTKNVKLRIVQTKFEQKDKFDPLKSVEITKKYLSESISPGIENITHIVWPEGAVSGLALEDESLLFAMGQYLAQRTKKPPVWLLNSLRHELRPSLKSNGSIDYYYNTSAAITFDEAGSPSLAAYSDKVRLVPFGEFIPGGKWMEIRKVPVISTSLLSISSALKKQNIVFPGLPVLSAQICYEIIFSGFTPHPKNKKRPQWILNQSNDAWFGNSFGPFQHSNMAAYRAIEEGVPVVRAAANGVSGIISPLGHYEQYMGPKETGFLDVKLPKPKTKTFFSTHVNYVLFSINLLIAMLVSFSVIKNTKI
jgi:apolipoprotein N-acyltransferase